MIGQQHRLAQRLRVLALLVQLLHRRALRTQRVEQRTAFDADVARELPSKRSR